MYAMFLNLCFSFLTVESIGEEFHHFNDVPLFTWLKISLKLFTPKLASLLDSRTLLPPVTRLPDSILVPHMVFKTLKKLSVLFTCF